MTPIDAARVADLTEREWAGLVEGLPRTIAFDAFASDVTA